MRPTSVLQSRARPAAVVLATLAALSAPPVVNASPDFGSSTIVVLPSPPREGDLVAFEVTLRNSGSEPAESASLSVEWPLMGYLIAVDGLEGATVDHERRSIEAAVSLAPGVAHTFAVRVLAPRDSGGDALTLSVRLAHYASGIEHWDHATVTIDSRVTGGYVVGGLRVTSAGLAVLVWVAVGATGWAALRLFLALRGRSRRESTLPPSFIRRLGPEGAVAAIMIAIGFWMVFATMAWRDYQVLTAWTGASCTVAGRRMVAQTPTSSSSSSASRPRSSTTYAPELALRYLVDGREQYSTGFDTGSSLRIGGASRRLEEVSRWEIGSVVPCWFDPGDPTDVVVQRGFGGAYVFAFFPLPVFAFGIAALRRL